MAFRRLEDLRVCNDKTQLYMAKTIDCPPEVYKNYEKGIYDIPANVLIKLSKFYGVSIDYILGQTSNPVVNK